MVATITVRRIEEDAEMIRHLQFVYLASQVRVDKDGNVFVLDDNELTKS